MAYPTGTAPDPAIALRSPGSLYIDGEWTPPAVPGRIDIVSPVTGELVGSVARAGKVDIDRAVAAARRAFDEGPWPRMTPRERIARLEKLGDALQARHAELARYWTMQIGALASIAPQIVVGGTANLLNMLEVGRHFPFEQTVSSKVASTAMIVQDAVGVVAAIVPWNSPYALLMGKIAPALVAGCTVIMKPSPETPLEAYVVAECAEEIGLPPGVLNLVPADREESAWLVANPGVDKVSFTGSTQAGRAIAAACAQRIARCTLELGGKSAAVVLDDYPIEDAARLLARTIIMLSGQICSMLSRVLVPRARQDALARAIADEMAKFRVGDPNDPGVNMGPIASQRQLERVFSYIRSARDEGARLVAGGGRPAGLETGCFVEPTLFADVRNDMKIAQEEVFGPVLCLIPYDDEEEAIRLANDSIYGLNGSVLTNDAAAAHRVARRIRTGKFAQNGLRVDFGLPSGGAKQSGIGREGGEEGLKAYLETKVMLMDAPAPAAAG